LLGLLVSDYLFFLPLLLNLFNYWFLFFRNNISLINKKNSWDNSISIKNIIVKQNPSFIIRINILFNLMFILYLCLYHGYSSTFWWSHFKINNYLLYLFLIVHIFSTYFLYLTDKHIKISNNYSIDYVFSLINITLFIPVIFLANTMFTFFFVIELVSCSIFYKFVVSKISFDSKNFKNNFFSIYSKNYLNVLFYQYWSSFFSSVLIVFSIYFIYAICGTTEWTVLNFIISTNFQLNYINSNIYFLFLSLTIIIGFIIKLGIAPIQLYKIELYKGLPFLSIFFYTAFYFLVFFLYFSITILYYLSSLQLYLWIILLVISLIGVVYILSMLFDINLFKAFLAYSTIINSIAFILIIIAIIL